MNERTFYDILDIPMGTSQKGISQAYKKQTLLWHQGRDARSEEAQHNMFVELRRAYDTLSNPAKRKKYGQENTLNLLDVAPVLKRLKREEMPIPAKRRPTSECVPPHPSKSRKVTSEKVPRPLPVAEPVASIDETVADASSEPKAEDSTVNQSEQVWYNIVGYAVKQVSEFKRPILQAYLKDSGIENKRVEAYVLGELAEDFFNDADYENALSFNLRAKQQYSDIVENDSGTDFDNRQLAKAIRNNILLERKVRVNSRCT